MPIHYTTTTCPVPDVNDRLSVLPQPRLIIFNPDVRFTDGYPGESCYNCVMPGITSLIAKGYVNEKAIGAQGHSWGAIRLPNLATRTRLFAAIESGAPVVNMLSAYGGIRWAPA